MASGVPATFTVSTTLHNNGPLSTVASEGGLGIAAPADCTLVPPTQFGLFNPVQLPSSVPVVQSVDWQVTCTTPGWHVFLACARVAPCSTPSC
jgi:hypothetical protein